MAAQRKRVAIVVPGSSRDVLTPDQEISLRHLTHHLGQYDAYLLVPKGGRLGWPGLRTLEVSRKYFGSVRAHNRMMLSRAFYELFSAYDFILNYHMDALVLSDQLLEWCDAGYDYIGAPVFNRRPPGTEPDMAYAATVNGGFSLRRVSAFQRVLESRVRQVDPIEQWRKGGGTARQKFNRGVRTPLKFIPFFNGVRWETRRHTWSEDWFWSERACHYAPLNVAPPREAVRFAFHGRPRYCLEQTGGELPFGVHAWARYDRAMWEPYLLTEGPASRAAWTAAGG